ncbi:MAG: carboxypeptidase-like regulatory domain-containing protein [Vicinamibacterales bacterium]
MRLRSIGFVLLGLLLAGVSTAWAQVSTTGTIQVIIEDPQGGRLPGVSVQASATDTVTSRTAVTDAEGVATLEALAPSARYTVKAQLSGFRDLDRADILVRSGQVTTLRVELQLSTVAETVTVQGQTTPLVDVTRATTGTDITLTLTESLPTGRSYQSYLQLVPGVMPDSQNASGNPASRSGMNWKDVVTNDNLGYSTDNFYYFEGINVTDPVTGTFGANLNTEIIQEQKVITGGIPAEYVGASGLISTVVTKSGTNSYSGSGTYYFQNNNLVAANKHLADNTFSSNDAAFTLGGPVLKNSLWAFGSYRLSEEHHRRQRAGHQAAAPHRGNDAEAGLLQDDLCADAARHPQLPVPERSVRSHRHAGSDSAEQPRSHPQAGWQQLLDDLQPHLGDAAPRGDLEQA